MNYCVRTVKQSSRRRRRGKQLPLSTTLGTASRPQWHNMLWLYTMLYTPSESGGINHCVYWLSMATVSFVGITILQQLLQWHHFSTVCKAYPPKNGVWWAGGYYDKNLAYFCLKNFFTILHCAPHDK